MNRAGSTGTVLGFYRRLVVLVALAAGVSLIAPPLWAQQQNQTKPKPPAKPSKPQANKPSVPAGKPGSQNASKDKDNTPTEPMTPSQIGIDTLGKQAYLIDVNTGTVLLAKDADVAMKPSSMAKMMTIYLLWEEMKAGRVTLDTQYRVSEAAWRMQGSKMFVALDGQVAVRDLIPGIIVHSGNDASVVVAEGMSGSQTAFAERMTKKGRDIGMTKTIFTNPDGWPDEKQFSTAHDLAILAQRTIRDFPDFYKQYYAEKEFKYQNFQTQFNRNPLIGKVAGADGLKTGHTDEAGYGLTGSVERGGRRIVLVINGLTSIKQRQQESERLVEWAFREFENYSLFKPGEIVAQADVWMGVNAKLPLTVTSNALLTLPRGARQSMKVTVVYDGPVKAPIKKGQPVGKLVVSGGNAATTEFKLVAAEDVELKGFFGRVVSGVKYYVLGQHS